MINRGPNANNEKCEVIVSITCIVVILAFSFLCWMGVEFLSYHATIATEREFKVFEKVTGNPNDLNLEEFRGINPSVRSELVQEALLKEKETKQ